MSCDHTQEEGGTDRQTERQRKRAVSFVLRSSQTQAEREEYNNRKERNKTDGGGREWVFEGRKGEERWSRRKRKVKDEGDGRTDKTQRERRERSLQSER